MAAGPFPPPDRLYDDAPCGLLLADADGVLLAVNNTLARWLQCEAAQLVGRRFPDLLTMGGRIFHQTHIAPLLRMQGSVSEVKLEMRCPNGTAFPVIVNAVQRMHDGRPLLQFAVFVAADRHKYERELLAQRQRAEALLALHEEDQRTIAAAQAQAEERARFAERMVAIVSHDLRNPLGTITMGVTVLGMGALSDEQRTVLKRIERGTQRAERLIADLLDVTQARLGRGLTLRRSRVNLHDVIAEATAEWSAVFAERRIVHARSGPGECEVDPERIVQAVGNLVRNAVAYGAVDTPVTVATAGDSDAFRLSVHNGGEPIPPEQLSTLFEPMVRGPDATEHSQQGLGLGLYIVRAIATAHEGSVEVRSDAASGTRFTLVLPAAGDLAPGATPP
jgi:sigma-B regulation protein RsbU (phosphoserine phosphatase)